MTTDVGSGPRQALPVLTAIAAALDDPERLVRVLSAAEDDEAAVAAVAEEFSLAPAQARSVLDQQFRLLTRPRRAALAEELRVLRAEWGPPEHAALALYGSRSGLLTVDGDERHLTGHDLSDVLSAAARVLTEQVAVPRLAPVMVAVTGTQTAAMTVWPTGGATFNRP